MAIERSFNLIKPLGVERNLVGYIIKKFSMKGLQLTGLKMVQPTREIVAQNYIDNKDEPFYNDLVDYVSSGPVVCMIWTGENAVESARQVVGDKNPLKSDVGSIRGSVDNSAVKNVIHGARTPEEAEREILLWFGSVGPPPLYEAMPAAVAEAFPQSIKPS
jgi:nucleoside-diphosphate kinase